VAVLSVRDQATEVRRRRCAADFERQQSQFVVDARLSGLCVQAWLTWRPTRDTSVQSFVRCRRARALMLRYLYTTGDRPVTVFPPALRYSLQRHLAIGKGDTLVQRAQDIAVQVDQPHYSYS